MQNLSDYSNYVLVAYAFTILTISIFFGLSLYRYLKIKIQLRNLKNDE